MVRKEVKQLIVSGMKEDKLVLLKFTKEEERTELRWEHSGEFEYKGQMYDIVEKVIKGDTIYYWCWWDRRETELNKQLDKLVARILGNNPQKKDTRDKIVDFYKNLYFSKYLYNSSALMQNPTPLHHFFARNFHSIDRQPPVPPPIGEWEYCLWVNTNSIEISLKNNF